MKMRHVRPRQNGFLALTLMLILFLATAGIWMRPISAGIQPGNDVTQQHLQLAKTALIARAVSDANRPGSLPCPDLLTNDSGLSNYPGDGKSDNLTRNDCPTYLGWLPWATLDLGDLTDEHGQHFWYALSRNFRDDDNAPPLNSEITGQLGVDASTDIAAIIFSPGPPLPDQNRPSHTPADYLEGSNADGDEIFVSGPADAHFNDRLILITRQELLAAVEQRVINGVRSCLSQHATMTAKQAFPWPAPFSSVLQRGHYGSYFGQIPLTQPGSGPQQALGEQTRTLTALQSQLPKTVSPDMNSSLIDTLEMRISALEAFADQLYVVTKDIALQAGSIYTALGKIDAQFISAESNGRISVTERSSLRTASEALLLSIEPLRQAIVDSGIDPFPEEVLVLAERLSPLLATAILQAEQPLSAELQSTIHVIEGLLRRGSSSNSSIADALTSTRNLSQATVSAVNAASDPVQRQQAYTLMSDLISALRMLNSTILGQRNISHPPVSSGDHVSLESLVKLAEDFRSSLNVFASVTTRTQAEMIPYAENLRLAAVDLLPWVEMLQRHSATLSSLARKSPTATKTQENSESTYQTARSALDSINSSSGLRAKMDAYLAAPTRTDKQAAANSALQATAQKSDTLTNSLAMLGGSLNSSTAQAFPMIWQHPSCTFLQTYSDRSSWWSTHRWAETIFYQFSSPSLPATNGLRINDRGNYPLIVLSAGKTLVSQDRALRRSQEYFEGSNASESKNGDALTPDQALELRPVGRNFNDRIAF